MDQKMPDWLKPALWGGVVGALALGIVLFSTGWAVTSGEAQDMVTQEREKAVLSALTPICVAQFKQATSTTQQQTLLATLEDENSWDREDFVSEHGWATMPGSSKPNDEVADACAQELMKLGDA